MTLDGCVLLVIAVVAAVGIWMWIQSNKKPPAKTVEVAGRDVVVQGRLQYFPGQRYEPTGSEEIHPNILRSDAVSIPLPAHAFRAPPLQQQFAIVRWIPHEARAYFSFFREANAREKLVQLITDSYKVQPYLSHDGLNVIYQSHFGIRFLPIVFPQGYGPPPPSRPGLPPSKPSDEDRFVQRFTEIINSTKTLTEAEKAWAAHKRTMPNHFDPQGKAIDDLGRSYDGIMSDHFRSFKDKLK